MKRYSPLSIAVTAMILAVFAHAQAAPTAQRELASVDYLVGNWSCTHTVGSFSGKYNTTYTKVLGDRWLKQTYDFPPQHTAERNEQGITAETLIGYDEGRHAWVRF